MNDTPQSYWNRKQVASFAQISIESIKRWEKAGLLKGYKVGPKLVRYKEADVRALISARAA